MICLQRVFSFPPFFSPGSLFFPIVPSRVFFNLVHATRTAFVITCDGEKTRPSIHTVSCHSPFLSPSPLSITARVEHETTPLLVNNDIRWTMISSSLHRSLNWQLLYSKDIVSTFLLRSCREEPPFTRGRYLPSAQCARACVCVRVRVSVHAFYTNLALKQIESIDPIRF